MPPSKHSSGSSFRSSSSFSRSSSSRSSSSSFRSSSSSSRSYSSGPSRKSSSSHSSSSFGSSSAYRTVPKTTQKTTIKPRSRMNQPIGYMLGGALAPRRYYGRRHDYVYYPSAWTDSSTGRYYEKGYYDEDGKYYSDVSFQKDGKYSNVICQCPYCGNETIINLDNMTGTTQDLQCPNCTGQMEIKSELDEVLNESEADSYYRTRDNDVSELVQEEQKKKHKNTVIIIVAILALLLVRGSVRNALRKKIEPVVQPTIQAVQTIDNNIASNTNDNDELQLINGVQIIEGRPVYLELNSDGGYHAVNDPIRADKIMPWNSDYESWYDSGTDCYVWYNTDVSPRVWQYWYEGISSDYGDYGWMEHDADGWWIEASQNNWIKLPSRYNTSNLWYISG